MPLLQETELILTPDKRVYHLNLRGEDIADSVIVVGDQDRVSHISSFFQKIDFRTAHREFHTHSGTYNGRRLTVISTGIGTDNIDIVLNELDAAVNIDPDTRTVLPSTRTLNIFRLGTCGALQPDIEVDALLASTHGIGLDGLLHFYSGMRQVNEETICDAFIRHMQWHTDLPKPYVVSADESLLSRFRGHIQLAMTATAPGFYAPQGRQLRLEPAIPDLNQKLSDFRYDNLRIGNFEMETSALYGLGKLLGHRCLTICVVIANRARKEFSKDYHKSIDNLIKQSLDLITSQ